jgi:H+-transporting ATPase
LSEAAFHIAIRQSLFPGHIDRIGDTNDFQGPFWSSIPSWQLAGAIVAVDIIATMFTIFGWFIGGQTSIVAVVRIYIFSFGVFCVMGGVYYLLQDSQGFDNLMHGKSIKKDTKQRSLEDFGEFQLPCQTYIQQANPHLSCVITACLHAAREECLNSRYPKELIVGRGA